MKRLTTSILQVSFFAVALLSACGGKIQQGRPCDGVNPPPECGVACTDDTSCGPDFYCGADSKCTADCTPGGSECGANRMCGEHGRCVEQVIADAPDCPDVNVDLTPVQPTVMLVIDQSGSMDDPFGNLTRWEAVRYGLTDPAVGAVTTLEANVKFGGMLYHCAGNPSLPAFTYSAGNPPGQPLLSNRAAVDDLLAQNAPSSYTPTAAAVNAVVPGLVALRATDPSPQIIVLATDGAPNTCGSTTNDIANVVIAVQGAFSNSIPTYVLGVSDGAGLANLQAMANAGAGRTVPPDPDAPYYLANNPAELVNAFNQIIGSARSCTFTLDQELGSDGSDGTVTLDTGNGPVTLVLGTDWILVDSWTIQLIGSACDTYLGSPTAIFNAVFPCGSVIIP